MTQFNFLLQFSENQPSCNGTKLSVNVAIQRVSERYSTNLRRLDTNFLKFHCLSVCGCFSLQSLRMSPLDFLPYHIPIQYDEMKSFMEDSYTSFRMLFTKELYGTPISNGRGRLFPDSGGTPCYEFHLPSVCVLRPARCYLRSPLAPNSLVTQLLS